MHAPLAALFNHLLADAPWAQERLALHQGRHVEILAPAPLPALRFSILAQGRLQPAPAAASPDLRLFLENDAFSKFVGGGIGRLSPRLEGDAELAESLGFVLRHLEWDYEADLARLFGDIAGHRLAELFRQALKTGQRAGEGLTANLAEYAREEQAWLVSQAALLAHRERLTRLRDDIARADKRLERLEQRMNPGT